MVEVLLLLPCERITLLFAALKLIIVFSNIHPPTLQFTEIFESNAYSHLSVILSICFSDISLILIHCFRSVYFPVGIL
jgi:hypothetical protein